MLTDRPRSYNRTTHVVAVRILHERERVVRDLVHQLDALVIRRMVYAALQHAAAVPVRRNLDAVRRDGVVDELRRSQPMISETVLKL